jgi:hypothetical protein
LCFTGTPGIGKTFLLRNIAGELRDRGWLCGYTEAGPDLGSAIDDILADARQMAPHRSAIRRLAARVTGFNAAAPGFSVGLSLQGADGGSAYTRLVGLFREISSRAGSGINGAALLLDEAQVLPDAHLSQLFRALGAVEDSRIVLFMAALPGLAGTISSMSQTNASWRRQTSRAFVHFSGLRALDQASAGSALLYQSGTAGGEIEPEAVVALTGFALGHPMTLQMLGRSAWNVAAYGTSGDGKVVIRAAHADRAIAEVSKQLRTIYHKPDWKKCTERERAVLKKIAGMGGSATGRELAHAVKGAGPDPAAVMSDLADGGLLCEDPDTEAFSIVMPGFRQFVMSA